jgi:hypothetical protein
VRRVLARTREEPGEVEWIIAAAEIVIDSVFAEKRLTNGTTEKTRESSWAKTGPFKAPKIL